jgi:hypothetical protein
MMALGTPDGFSATILDKAKISILKILAPIIDSR